MNTFIELEVRSGDAPPEPLPNRSDAAGDEEYTE
jgi:hypothetical protein